MAFTTITQGDIADKGVVGMPDKPDLTTLQMQQKLDELATDVIIPKHNGLIAELEAGAAGASIGVMDGATATNLQARLDAIAAGGYTKAEADEKFLTITGAEETYLTQSSAESTYLAIEDAPTKVSDLTNDSGYITSADVPTKTSDLTNDSGFVTSADIPTKVSDLTNDSGFITSASVDSLTDTNISSPSDGQVLKYDSTSSKWVNGTGGGGGASDLDDLTDVAISSATNGQVLTYDSSTSKWKNADVTISGTLPTSKGGTGNTSGYIQTGKVIGIPIAINATAEGTDTISMGDASHAEGSNTRAAGDYSHAGGYHTQAEYDYQTAIGKWNSNQSSTLFEIGNGTGSSAKSNAFEVYANGDINCTGAIMQNGTDVIGKKLTATISSGTTLSFTDSSILSTSILDLYVDSNTPVNYDSVTVTSGSGATFTLSEAVTSSTTFLLIVR